jgi:hypothetical protein
MGSDSLGTYAEIRADETNFSKELGATISIRAISGEIKSISAAVMR